ncbi:hydroxylamine reductase [Desulfobulbus oligotrophicus]|uniref:Hydroxylamine reductase n=1 Tax=Desulfobulbus oligotrophicus TaxID=1909699 RepID=A0A7T5VF77_9BACT|nr:hydroxylamine reductase [Desulfobulbus oligotrophicus]QQG66731.1 hydroxylamine reductase [Desulfobulbus oligotrophicus]
MFCNQCEQTAKGSGCTVIGVCGKNEEVADLQDLLIYAMQGLALYAQEGRRLGIVDGATDHFTFEAIFSTLTNVDFDPDRFVLLIKRAVELREAMKAKVAVAGGKTDFTEAPASFIPTGDVAELTAQGKALNLIENLDTDDNIRSLKQTLLYGLKGIAAYADHAAILGKTDPAVAAFCYEALSMLLVGGLSVEACVPMVMKAGEINLKAMELLDAGNTGAYGHPVPTSVPLGHRKNKCILITGHDLHDLELLLKQTEGKGIDIYTHGEMLPCHGYPELKKYPHFYGHFGTAWQNQQKEFPTFPGPILFTTNCIQKPRDDYKDRVFTNGLVGWPGVKHIINKDYSAVVEMALAMPGFTDDVDNGSVMVGFARNAVLGVADKVIEAVKSKAIRHFFLVGGCDGAKPGRDYFTRFVEQVPSDCVVLTLACGKFRFFDKQLGDIGGIPRLLDVGQCNDAYSAIQIAVALAQAFDCEVNDLPLSMIISWYEQKAVAVLLTLLYLGIKDIRLGPSLPAFVSPAVLEFLVNTFDIKPIDTPENDLKTILG